MLVYAHLYITAGISPAFTTICTKVPFCSMKLISAAYHTVFQTYFLCLGTKVNKMGLMAWKRLYSQADIGYNTCCKQLYWHGAPTSDLSFGGQRTLPWFLASILNSSSSLLSSSSLSLHNRLLHSDFHIGRCAGERDGVSPRAESPQGDRPGARHSVDWGVHR